MFCMLCLQAAGHQAGLAGLQNLGDSCFMSAAVQCLAHTAPLKSVFLTDAYKVDVNRDNVNGSKGAVVTVFGDVMQALWQVGLLVFLLQCHAVFDHCMPAHRFGCFLTSTSGLLLCYTISPSDIQNTVASVAPELHSAHGCLSSEQQLDHPDNTRADHSSSSPWLPALAPLSP